MVETELPGFSAIPEDDDGDHNVEVVKKKTKKSGGFQSMGFHPTILKGIKNRGYKIPTPIQRKTVPLALEGRDVVAMARTGSGKTACFVLPILDKLLSNSSKSSTKSVRALILTPTRELALQTLRFVRDLGRYTGLKSNAVLGGDSLEQQFGTMQLAKPDVIVATPGRFLHLCVEMDLSLSGVEIVVFDEGDRLFELGFGEQLREILARLPISRQTLLFSATLPSMLVEFARAGLTDPTLIRLDVEWKLPTELWLGYVWCRSEQREAALLILLSKLITKKTPQAIVFTATRHHCEYLHLILGKAGIDSTYIYSGLDSSARKIATGKFIAKKVPVLIVTDVAARGLDLPSLDTVINYNFPAKPKLFVHRVGRSARAGRSGRAISIVSPDDVAHLLDLHLFLGSTLVSSDTINVDLESLKAAGKECPSCVIGTLPSDMVDMRQSDILQWQQEGTDVSDMKRVCTNAWGQYLRCRENASSESNKRAKLIDPPSRVHPFFSNKKNNKSTLGAEDLISQMKNYKPKGTILELGAKNDAPNYIAMKAKRKWDQDRIKPIVKTEFGSNSEQKQNNSAFDTTPETDLSTAFPTIVGGHSKFDEDKLYMKKKKKKEFVRDPNYIPHQSSNHHTESGLAVNFGIEAQKAQLEMAPDTHEDLRKGHQAMKWDRKRKRMVHVDGDKGKMIKTESGNRIPASYRSGRYEAWKKRNNQMDDAGDADDDDDTPAPNESKPVSEFRPRWMKYNERMAQKKVAKNTVKLKTNQQILKDRLKKQKLKAKQKGKKGKAGGKGGKGKK